MKLRANIYLPTRNLLALASLAICLLVVSSTEVTAQESGWGNLKGKIVVSGEVPTADDVRLSTDDKDYCEDTGQTFKSRELVVGAEGQLSDAYVMMYFGRGDRKRPKVHPSYDEAGGDVALDNINCRFEPRAIFVRKGKSIEFKNSDRIGHNCHVVTMNFEENCSLGAGQKLKVEMEDASRTPGVVKCDAHPWMEALLLVREEPYAAVTDAEGNFQIANLPAGEWTFQFWHVRSGYMRDLEKDGDSFVGRRGEVKVTIKDGETLDLGTLMIDADSLANED